MSRPELVGGANPWPKWESKPSVASRGGSYDSVLTQTINTLYKTELIYRRGPWHTMEGVKLATLEWFNNRRLLEPIGNILPAAAEALF